MTLPSYFAYYFISVVFFSLPLVSSSNARCYRPVKIELPECQNTFYNYTGLPNLVGQESQDDARHQLQTFKPLIAYKCSKQLNFFLCSVYVPMCDVNTHHLIGPCRPLCERVRRRCSPVLRVFAFDWPDNLNCSKFPETNSAAGVMCMDGPEDDVQDFEDADEVIQIPADHTPTEKSSEATALHEQDVEATSLQVDLKLWLSQLDASASGLKLASMGSSINAMANALRHCSHLLSPTAHVFINRTGRCAQHCLAHVLFQEAERTLARVWASVLVGLCFFSSTFTLFTYLICSASFHPLERAIVSIAGCQLIYALAIGLGLRIGRQTAACGRDPASGTDILLQEGLDNSYCALIFLLQYFFFTAGALWWAMLMIGWMSRCAACRGYAGKPKAIPLTRDQPAASGSQNVRWQGAVNQTPLRSGSDSTSRYMEVTTPTYASVPSQRLRTTADVQPMVPSLPTFDDAADAALCLTRLHLFAWLIPGLLTVGVLVSRQVDADELLGICGVGYQNTSARLAFTIIPQATFLIIGAGSLLLPVFQTLRQRRHPSIAVTTSGSPVPSRNLTFPVNVKSEPPRGLFMSTSWETLNLKLCVFTILYLPPAICLLSCDIYEYTHRDRWLGAGSKDILLAPIYRGKDQSRPQIELLLLRHFASLIIGFICSVWLVSMKGLTPWRKRFSQKADSDNCFSRCLFTHKKGPDHTVQLNHFEEHMMASAVPTTIPRDRQSKTSGSVNTSSSLRPYAIYRPSYNCESGYPARPPAGPGVDASEQLGSRLPEDNLRRNVYHNIPISLS